tara:strand:+ start:644 stop:1201 length:558 start_codon:yes stop_codon:yes gene_type:complete
MLEEKLLKKKLLYLFYFGLILGIFRIIPHPPNFTPILASAIVAPILLKSRIFGILIPILAMFISDIIIGFHSYQFVIYLTLLSIGLVSPLMKNYKFVALMSLLSSLWFFIVTNFAVWLMWEYYPKNIEGLIACYTLALPFFKNTIISTFIFAFLILFLSKYLIKVNEKANSYIYNFIYKFRNISR